MSRFIVHDGRFLGAAVVSVGVAWVLAAPVLAQNIQAEESYQRFRAIYQRDAPTVQELSTALKFLETANRLAPNTYKYVFALGALNNTLGNYEPAVQWLEKAQTLAAADQRQDIQTELAFAQTQLAKERVRTWGGPGIEITLIMKKGVPELTYSVIQQFPRRLPMVTVGAPTEPLEQVLRQTFAGRPFDVLLQTPFLVASVGERVPPQVHYDKGIKDFYRYFVKEYFEQLPQRVVVTLISADPMALIEATKRLYPDVHLPLYAPFLGYFNPTDNLIMATGGGAGYGTLLHEMIHALMAADFPQAPAWLNEGLASLYERTQWRGSRLDALPNWRLDGLREDQIPSLKELVRKASDISLHGNIAEIRLFLLYLDQRRQVADLYRMARREGPAFSLDQAAAALGLREDDWQEFVRTTFRDYRAEIARDRGMLSNPDEVRFVQQALNQILGSNLKVDGLWGRSTSDKLVEFQRRFGLKPDGTLGPKTMTELKRRYTLVRLEALSGRR